VDYEHGQVASRRAPITSVTNLTEVPVIVGMNRGPLDIVSRVRLGIGDRTTVFNGEFWGAWEAAPEMPEGFGPDGCEDGVPPGNVVVVPRGDPMVIRPRPVVRLLFQLDCAPL
jgi:hypothetical protein